MRLHEIALRHLPEDGNVSIVTIGDVAEVLLLPVLPDRVQISSSTGVSLGSGDLLVAEVGDPAGLDDVLRAVPEGGRAVLLTETPADQLPVGPLLDAVLSNGTQVLEAWTLHQARVRTAVVVIRTAGVVAPAPYLQRLSVDLAPADAPTLRRIVAEWTLLDLVGRARAVVTEAMIGALRDDVAKKTAETATMQEALSAANADLESSRGREAATARRLRNLEQSTSWRVGRTLTTAGRPLARWRRARAGRRPDGR